MPTVLNLLAVRAGVVLSIWIPIFSIRFFLVIVFNCFVSFKSVL